MNSENDMAGVQDAVEDLQEGIQKITAAVSEQKGALQEESLTVVSEALEDLKGYVEEDEYAGIFTAAVFFKNFGETLEKYARNQWGAEQVVEQLREEVQQALSINQKGNS